MRNEPSPEFTALALGINNPKTIEIRSNNNVILAQGMVFKDGSCAIRLFYCKNPFLIQEKYNKQEFIHYVYENLPPHLTEKGFTLNGKNAYWKKK